MQHDNRDSTQAAGIYAIINIVTGRSYIGLTRNSFAVRWMVHRYQLTSGTHHNASLQADWNTYTEAAFTFQIVEVIDQREGNDVFLRRERFYISQATQPIYNGRPSADHLAGHPRRHHQLRNSQPAINLANGTFAELLENLFESRRRPDGEHYTNEEICAWIRNHIPNTHLSVGYLRKLRSGQSSNPSREVLLALCYAFQVNASHFFPELQLISPAKVSSEERMRLALREQGLDKEAEECFTQLFKMLITPERD